MVDVHAVLLGLQRGLGRPVAERTVGVGIRVGIRAAHLVARVLVDASPVAMVVAAILEVVAVRSEHGQSAASCQRAALRIASYHIISHRIASQRIAS